MEGGEVGGGRGAEEVGNEGEEGRTDKAGGGSEE